MYFSRSVRTQKPERLSAGDLNRQISNGGSGSVAFLKPGCIDGQSGHSFGNMLLAIALLQLRRQVDCGRVVSGSVNANTIPLSTHISEKCSDCFGFVDRNSAACFLDVHLLIF